MSVKKLFAYRWAVAREFFSVYCPNVAIIRGILEGKIYGKILLNKSKDGCLLMTNSPFNFFAGHITDDFLMESIALLANNNHSFLIHCHDSEFFEKKNLPTKRRVHLSCYPDEIKLIPEKLKDRLLSRYVLKKIDFKLFEQCCWKNRLIEFYKTTESFLSQSYGVVLLDGEQIVSEVYGTIGGNFLELGGYVHPLYRGNGSVPFIIAEIVNDFCLPNGLIVTASCDIDNFVSKQTVMRLGLKEDFEYAVLDIASVSGPA